MTAAERRLRDRDYAHRYWTPRAREHRHGWRGANLERTLEIAEWLGTRTRPFTCAEFAQAFGLHARTAHREVFALEAAGWVLRHDQVRRVGLTRAPALQYVPQVEIRRRRELRS